MAQMLVHQRPEDERVMFNDRASNHFICITLHHIRFNTMEETVSSSFHNFSCRGNDKFCTCHTPIKYRAQWFLNKWRKDFPWLRSLGRYSDYTEERMHSLYTVYTYSIYMPLLDHSVKKQ